MIRLGDCVTRRVDEIEEGKPKSDNESVDLEGEQAE
jgi:hypothetical protein